MAQCQHCERIDRVSYLALGVAAVDRSRFRSRGERRRGAAGLRNAARRLSGRGLRRRGRGRRRAVRGGAAGGVEVGALEVEGLRVWVGVFFSGEAIFREMAVKIAGWNSFRWRHAGPGWEKNLWAGPKRSPPGAPPKMLIPHPRCAS
jgi:hypothetical protein